ncbi:hypothetical protein [Azotobacter armeniacus]
MTRLNVLYTVLALLIGGVLVFGIWVVIRVLAPIMGLDDTYASLIKNGQAMEGRVLLIEPTNTLINNQPVSRFTIGYLQGNTETQVVFEQRVPFTDLPRVQPGSVIPLRVGQAADGQVVIDLGRLNAPLGKE